MSSRSITHTLGGLLAGPPAAGPSCSPAFARQLRPSLSQHAWRSLPSGARAHSSTVEPLLGHPRVVITLHAAMKAYKDKQLFEHVSEQFDRRCKELGVVTTIKDRRRIIDHWNRTIRIDIEDNLLRERMTGSGEQLPRNKNARAVVRRRILGEVLGPDYFGKPSEASIRRDKQFEANAAILQKHGRSADRDARHIRSEVRRRLLGLLHDAQRAARQSSDGWSCRHVFKKLPKDFLQDPHPWLKMQGFRLHGWPEDLKVGLMSRYRAYGLVHLLAALLERKVWIEWSGEFRPRLGEKLLNPIMWDAAMSGKKVTVGRFKMLLRRKEAAAAGVAPLEEGVVDQEWAEEEDDDDGGVSMWVEEEERQFGLRAPDEAEGRQPRRLERPPYPANDVEDERRDRSRRSEVDPPAWFDPSRRPAGRFTTRTF